MGFSCFYCLFTFIGYLGRPIIHVIRWWGEEKEAKDIRSFELCFDVETKEGTNRPLRDRAMRARNLRPIQEKALIHTPLPPLPLTPVPL